MYPDFSMNQNMNLCTCVLIVNLNKVCMYILNDNPTVHIIFN